LKALVLARLGMFSAVEKNILDDVALS